MVGQLSLRLGTVVAIGCGVGALSIACRGTCIGNFLRHLTGSVSQPKSAEAIVDSVEADAVTPSPAAQSQVVAAPEVSQTYMSSSETAAETASEADLQTAVSESKPSCEPVEAAEVLVADAFMEACSTVMPQGADAAGGAHDSNTPSKVEGSCGQSAVIDHKQQRKPKKEKQYKVVAAPRVLETGTCPSETAAETASEADLHTAASKGKASAEVAEAAEVLVDDHACTEARSTVTPQGADVAGGEHDSNTPSEAADHEQRRKGKKKKAKGKCREITQCRDLDLAALEARAEQAAAELLRQEEKEKAAKTKAATKNKTQKHRKVPSKSKASPPCPGCITDVPPAAEDAGLLNRHGDLGAEDTVNKGDGAGPLGSVDSAAELHQLRCDWETLLEQAARCKDATLQPSMLDSVSQMLQRCRDAGISVKYGSKVLQRLQAVGPARAALEAALGANTVTYEELEAALTAAKGCKCLLQDDLVQLAETVMATLKIQADLEEQQQAKQQQIQQQQAQQQAKSQQPQQQQRRQAGQQVQMHEPVGRAVLMIEPLTYPSTPARAHQSTAEPRPARQSAQQSSAAITSSGMSKAAAASSSHTGRQLSVLGSTSRQMMASAAPGRREQGLPCGIVGLQNLGQSCYQNSLLQCINCCSELVQPLLCASQQIPSAAGALNLHRRPKASVCRSLSDLLTEMRAGQHHSISKQRVISPHRFRKAMATVDVRWGQDTQQDCQEFLHSLLAKLQAEANRVQGRPQYKELLRKGTQAEQAAEAQAYARSWHDSFVDDVLGGLLQSTVTCSNCLHHSHCFDTFLDLCVQIPTSKKVSLQDCLSAFFEEEVLTGSGQMRCSACRQTCNATKRLQLYQYPKLLVLSLKRFNNGSEGDSAAVSKNEALVEIDGHQLLDLAPCCSSTGLMAAAGKGYGAPRYELVAVSEHYVRLTGGHYITQGRSVADGQWYTFDDCRVTAGSCPSGSSRTAYVLFYRLLDG